MLIPVVTLDRNRTYFETAQRKRSANNPFAIVRLIDIYVQYSILYCVFVYCKSSSYKNSVTALLLQLWYWQTGSTTLYTL
jgi:hypothetical protein